MPYKASSHQPLNWTDRTPLSAAETAPQSRDWVLEPTGQWKYAVDPDAEKMTVVDTTAHNRPLASQVWTREAVPVALLVDGYPVDWPEEMGTAAVPPTSPVSVQSSEKTKLRLIPYGAAKLHIAQFPVADVGGMK